jgi:type I restriction enzyme, S subunit
MTSQKRNIKKSDLSWLKQLPQNWDVLPNRAIFKERNTRNTIDERLLSVTIKKGVISQSSMIQQSSKKDSSNEDKTKYKLVLPGDIVYNKMRMWQGAVGYSNLRGIVSPAYIVLRSSRDIFPKYFHYLFRSPAYSKECHKYSHGICDDQMSLRFEDFKTITSILPPIEEQRAIVHFLDYKCAQINSFIQKKKRLIELLKEQKQVIINQAVTRGLNPNVRLKPSGVEWLGDIPEHWEVRKFKNFANFFSGGTPSKSIENYWKGHIPWASPKDMKQALISTTTDNISEHALRETNSKLLPKGSLLIVVRSGILRRIIPTAITKCELTFNQDIKGVCVEQSLINSQYILLLIQGYNNILLRKWRKIGATVESLEFDWMRNTYFSIPPLHEQLIIIKHLEDQTRSLEDSITNIEKQIALIQEYRTRLISDVVTGQIDVRNIEVGDIPENELIEEAFEDEQEEESLELVGAGDDY